MGQSIRGAICLERKENMQIANKKQELGARLNPKAKKKNIIVYILFTLRKEERFWKKRTTKKYHTKCTAFSGTLQGTGYPAFQNLRESRD
jgi:hypothetical protein